MCSYEPDRVPVTSQLPQLHWRYLCFSSLLNMSRHYSTHKNKKQYRQIGPFPCVPNLSGLTATENCRLETKLSLFLLFISRPKYTKPNSIPVLISKKDSKVHSKPPKAAPHNCCLENRADENKFKSRGRRTVQLRMLLWYVSVH